MRALATWTERAALLLVVLLAGLLALRHFNDFDVFWHVKTGEWILAEHRVPSTDPFGAVTAGRPWLDVAWGAQLVMALVARAAGLAGLQLAAVAIVMVSLAVLLARGPRTPPVLAGALLFVLTAWARFLVRPDLLTLPLILVLLVLLERLPGAPRSATALLGLLTVAWVNLHGSFALAPILVGAAALAALLARAGRYRLRDLAIALVVTALAVVVNPFGTDAYSVLAPYARSAMAAVGLAPAARRLPISEWMPIWRVLRSNAAFPTQPFVLLVAVLAWTFLRQGRSLAGHRLLAAGALGLATVLATRNLLPFAACALGVILLNERDLAGREAASAHGVGLDPVPLRAAAAVGVGLLAAGTLVSVATDRFYVVRDLPHRTGVGADLELLPEGAVQWLARHRYPGPAFNNFDSGAYLLYRLYPHFWPYQDARVVDPDFFIETQQAAQDPARFADLVRRDGIGTVILVHPSPESLVLLPALARDPHWKIVFRDHNSTIHVRADLPPPTERPHPIALQPPLETTAQSIDAWLRPLKRHTLPAAELTDAFVSGLIGDRAREISAYRRALARAPDNPRALAFLGSPGGAAPIGTPPPGE